MGDDAEVVSPQELRDEMGEIICRMSKKYTR